MKKKIIQVLPALNVGGAEMLVKEYLLHFDTTMYDAEILVMGKKNHSILEQALTEHHVQITHLSDLYHVPAKLPYALRRIWVALGWRTALKKYLRKKKPDVLHCHLSVANKLISAKAQLKHVKLFYTVHSDPDKYWGNNKEAAEREAIRYFVHANKMHMIALNSESVPKLKKYFGEDCKISILNNGIDFERYRLPLSTRQKIKQALGLPEDSYVVGHVGRFFEPKNHDFLIDVFEKISQKKENAFLVLVGDGKLMGQIQAKAEALNISSKILFLGNRQDVNELLSTFDVFLFPSLWEGFPITLIEAQAAGLPCFISGSVNHEVKLTNLVTFIDLASGAENWANAILTHQKAEYTDIRLSHYDITFVMKKLLDLYGL